VYFANQEAAGDVYPALDICANCFLPERCSSYDSELIA
jgi:hypothetical protein